MRKRGISLIVLIITIIVVIILSAVVILTLSKNNPIESAKEATFKEDVRTFQDELALAVSKEYANAAGQRDEKITTSDFDEIKQYIPSFSEKYKEKFIIQDDELRYTKQLDDKEKEYAQSLNVYKKKSILPNEFQQVEYIESRGTQYIDTNLLAKTYNKIYVKIEGNYTITKGVQRLFGAGFHTDWKTNFSWALMSIAKNSHFVAQNGIGGTDLELKVADTQKHTFILDTELNLGWVDDISKSLDSNGLKLIDYNYLLFSINNQGVVQDNASFKMYSCEIKMNNVLIRKYIPCYCKEAVIDINGKTCPANTKGLYDIVEGKFYTNQGTGEDFIPGPDVD